MMRKAFQATMGDDLVSGVEEILGRKVVAFMSDNHIDPDVAVEVFILAPVGTAAQAGDASGDTAPSPVEPAVNPDAT
jgi:hypothetical protein